MILLLARLIRVGHRRHVALLLASAVGCLLGGGAAFADTQHVPLTTGWYWAVTTATTVGYGDVTPKDPTGRLIATLVMLTTIPLIGAAFALVTGSAAAAGVRRLLMRARPPEGHYRLIIGMHPAVPTILEELGRAGDQVVLLADVDERTVPEFVHLVRGDPTSADALRGVRPANALHALVCGADDGQVLVSTILVREQAPGLRITALARSGSVAAALRDMGVDQVLSGEELVAHTLAKSLEAPHAGDLLLRLLDSEHYRLTERRLGPDTPPRPLSQHRADSDDLVLGVVHDGSIALGVGEDPEIGPGDVLLVVAAGSTSRRRARRAVTVR